MEQMTIRDIARKCNVGVSTVSRAMNNHPDINPKTKERILQVISESNYVPNNSARNLKRTDGRAVAILVKGLGNVFFSNMIARLEDEVRRRKFACIIERVDERADEIDAAIRVAKEKRLKGIIFLGGNFSHPEEQLRRLEVPYVVSTIGTPSGGSASVSVNDYNESYKMVNYLCSLGHRRILTIASDEDDASIGHLRLAAYRRALADHGWIADPELICHMTRKDTFSYQTGYRIMKEVLARGTDFSAVYAFSDTLAIGVCRALHEAGLRVPEDVSVAGFDGIDAGEYHVPSITTIRQPVEVLARETARMLFGLIGKKEEPRCVFFDGELVARESTAFYARP